ncbi:MAG: hypothetical protein U0T81_05820 [Saprospiraceae bacterium]
MIVQRWKSKTTSISTKPDLRVDTFRSSEVRAVSMSTKMRIGRKIYTPSYGYSG